MYINSPVRKKLALLADSVLPNGNLMKYLKTSLWARDVQESQTEMQTAAFEP